MLTIPRIDYSSLIQAQHQDYDVQFAQLREEDRRNNNTAALIQGGFQLAGAVADVMKQADFEANKQKVANAQAALHDAARKAIANNDFVQETDDSGQVSIRLGAGYQDILSQMKDELPGGGFLPGTKRWITDSIDQADNEARASALDYAYTEFSRTRDASAKNNINQGILNAASLAADNYFANEKTPDEVDAKGLSKSQRSDIGIYSALDNVGQIIDSQTWRSPQERELLKNGAYREAGVQFSSIVARKKVDEAGLGAATAWLDKETGWTDQDRATILAAASAENNAQVNAAKETARTAFDAATAAGESPVSIRTKALQGVAVPFRDSARAAWDKMQCDWAHDQTMKTLSQVDTLDDLLSLRKTVQDNSDGRYWGEKGALTWDQQQTDLREIDSKIGFFGGEGKDQAAKDAQRHIADAYENYRQGNIDFYQARQVILDWGAQAGGDYQTTFMGRLRKDVPSALQPVFDNLPKTLEDTFLKTKGYKKGALLSADEQSDLASLQTYVQGLAMDIVQESKAGTPYSDILKRINQATSIYYAKEYDILRKPPQAKGGFLGLFGGQSEDQALARFLGKMNSSQLGDMVYQDESGSIEWAPGYADSVKSAYDALQARAEKATGKNLTFSLDREGAHDVLPTAYFEDPATRTRYRFEPTANETGLQLVSQSPGGTWKAVPAVSAPQAASAVKPQARASAPPPPEVQTSVDISNESDPEKRKKMIDSAMASMDAISKADYRMRLQQMGIDWKTGRKFQ
jgi:hypothetical protein